MQFNRKEKNRVRRFDITKKKIMLKDHAPAKQLFVYSVINILIASQNCPSFYITKKWLQLRRNQNTMMIIKL